MQMPFGILRLIATERIIISLVLGPLLLVNAACSKKDVENVAPPLTDMIAEEATVAVKPTAEATAITENSVTQLDGENLHLDWSYETGGAINHPPLHVDEYLIVIPAQGPLLALDAKSGTLRWKYEPLQRIWDRAYAADDRYLFVGIEGGELIALELSTGQPVWTKELGINMQVPPLVAGNVLYVPTTFVGPGLSNDPEGKAKLYALDIADGRTQWSFETGNYILQTPFLVGDALYAAGLFADPRPVDEGGHTRLYKLSADDGTVRWEYESEDGFPKQLYATDSAVAFIGYQDFANGVDADTGELRWRRDTGNWVPSLSGANGIIFFGSANTMVHALDMADGHIVWQHNILEGTFNYVLGAPVFVEDDLLFLTQHGDIMALDTANGTLRWQFSTNIISRTGLTVAGNWLFIGDEDGVVYAYASP